MKAVMLGATGNVGRRALSALIKHGHTVVAYVTDQSALKDAILAHNCDAVFYVAGVAQMFGHSKNDEYNKMFATALTAIVQAREERRGPAIRAWLMSGFPMPDSAILNHLIGDYMPIFPEHKENLALIQKQEVGNIT